MKLPMFGEFKRHYPQQIKRGKVKRCCVVFLQQAKKTAIRLTKMKYQTANESRLIPASFRLHLSSSTLHPESVFNPR
jgi:hypothetical protein